MGYRAKYKTRYGHKYKAYKNKSQSHPTHEAYMRKRAILDKGNKVYFGGITKETPEYERLFRRRNGQFYRRYDKPFFWFAADFETNTTLEGIAKCPVWAWGLAPFGADKLAASGHSIDNFMWYLKRYSGYVGIVFHNLGFDGEFIISWLLEHGWKAVDREFNHDMANHQFTVLRSNGKLYSIQFEIGHLRVLITDSYKKIHMSVRDMAKAFDLEYTKGEIDYAPYRGRGHRFTPEEYDYLERDVCIVAQAMAKLSEHVSNDKLTMGSDAYADWKARAEKKYPFEQYFDSLTDEEWALARKSYRGGICTVNERYKGCDTIYAHGRVYDVNSMYPSIMRYEELPYGPGEFFTGKPKFQPHTFTVFEVCADFELKAGQMPILRPKGYTKTWPQGQFMRSTQRELGHDIKIVLTSVDWDTYSQHYDITVNEWRSGYVYQTQLGMFDEYIDEYMQMKIDAGKAGNKALKNIAKYKLNNLYGKFGQCIDDSVAWLPDLTKDGAVKWVKHAKDVADMESQRKYMILATAITAYSRAKLCKAIRAAGERFVYADTDSVHIMGDALEGIEVDPLKLGAWDCESKFDAGKWLGAKAYAEHTARGWDYKLAGCPASALKNIRPEQFIYGAMFGPKLVPKRVPHGILLVDVGYELKER